MTISTSNLEKLDTQTLKYILKNAIVEKQEETQNCRAREALLAISEAPGPGGPYKDGPAPVCLRGRPLARPLRVLDRRWRQQRL